MGRSLFYFIFLYFFSYKFLWWSLSKHSRNLITDLTSSLLFSYRPHWSWSMHIDYVQLGQDHINNCEKWHKKSYNLLSARRAHFSLLMPYFSHTVSSTLSLSAASAHFDFKSNLNCLHRSPTIWSIFFFVLRLNSSEISNSAWQMKNYILLLLNYNFIVNQQNATFN